MGRKIMRRRGGKKGGGMRWGKKENVRRERNRRWGKRKMVRRKGG